jgi:hypothetical protein
LEIRREVGEIRLLGGKVGVLLIEMESFFQRLKILKGLEKLGNQITMNGVYLCAFDRNARKLFREVFHVKDA